MSKILLFDDEEDLLMDLSLLLEDHDFKVVCARSVSEALDLIEIEDFDAVLLDMQMPPSKNMVAESVDHGRTTGIAVAELMKAKKPDILIVALTVVSEPSIHERMKKVGISAIIQKPSDLMPIIETLNKEIQGKS